MYAPARRAEAEFLDVIGTKVLRVFLLVIYSHLYKDIPPPPPKSGLKLVCQVSIVYGNLKFENSQDYAQKSQRNFIRLQNDARCFPSLLFSSLSMTLSRCFSRLHLEAQRGTTATIKEITSRTTINITNKIQLPFSNQMFSFCLLNLYINLIRPKLTNIRVLNLTGFAKQRN